MIRVGGVAILALALAAGEAGAAAKPDLLVSSLADPPLTVVAGGTIPITDAVRNAGRARAAASSIAYYLSTDNRVGRGDVRLAPLHSVGRLAPRRASRRSGSVTVPASAKAGAYHLIACADARRRIPERSERNNCRASTGRVAVSLRPRPLSVTPVLDSARATSATVGPDGGVLTATAANGATVALTVPAGAVLSDVTITITPLASVTGLPFRPGLVAAVDLAPDGLRFLTPATLTITPPGPLAAADVAAFAYRGSGEGFHLRRSRTVGSSIELAITHFSGAGVAQANQAERSEAAGANPPADPADQAEQQAAVPVDGNALEAAVMQMYATIFGLAQSRATLDQAIVFYNAWLPVASGTRAAALWPALHTQLTARMLQFVNEARTACASQRVLDEAAWIIRIAFQSQTLAPPAPGVAQAAADALARCLRFELDVTAHVENNLELDRGHIDARVTALPITIQGGFTPTALSGSKTIEVLDYRIHDFDCWVHTWNPQPARPLMVSSMRLSGLNAGAAGPPGSVQVEAVGIDFGSVDDQVTHTCNDGSGSSFTNSMGIWDSGAPTIVDSDLVRSWTPAGQGVWRREFTRAAAPGQPSGTLTFVLRHAPQP